MAVRRPPKISPRRKVLSALVALAFSGATLANPTGPAVVSGSANFATVGKTLTVTNAPSAIINWQGFSIGTGETTRFAQQSAASAVLNRVVGQDPSAILGTLSSNGRVFLLNPNGILFGAGSRIDVAGLVASTLNLSNQDFLAGRLNFESGAVANSIVNYGNIATPAGGRVYLIAPNIENHGVISTPQGHTLLAAGKTVQLVEADMPNLRVEIQAGGEALNVGQILAEGGSAGIYAGLINQRGIVRADSASRDAAGSIVFRASGRTTLEAGSVTSASGAGGGTIEVSAPVVLQFGDIKADGNAGGKVQIDATNFLQAGTISVSGSVGAGGEISVNAPHVIQTAAAVMAADGAGGDGGSITVIASGAPDGLLFSSGTFSARGARGGNINLLGHDIVLLGASVDASGASGGGTILVGGDFQGRNPAVPNAATTSINFSTTLKADALVTGDGGKVIVWSDNETKFYGTVSARGGAQSGNGGLMEISGKENLTMGGFADAGAPNGKPGTLLLDPKNIVIDSTATSGLGVFQLLDPHPGANENFSQQILVLPNNNVVATDPNDSFVASLAGAAYLFNGTTGALISSLTGASANDQVGGGFGGGVTALTNGNYVVRSGLWANGVATQAGAVTFGSGTTGVTGVVSAANSLVGSQTNDFVGNNGVVTLSNGNYVVKSKNWANGAATNAGAVTFGSGTSGVSGAVSAANSLVGTTANDFVGSNNQINRNDITALSNGNYVVGSSSWNNGAATEAGAVTFGSGTTGVSGAVSAANSLVGTTAGSFVGLGGVTALTNGNYVVASSGWRNGVVTSGPVGAVTFGSGTSGVVGAVSAANSLVGTTVNDVVGSGRSDGTFGVTALGVTALTNGNYVVSSPNWNNGAAMQAGAVTFGSGTTGVTGVVSAANSLVGTTLFDLVGGGGVTALSNGNYVVGSFRWQNGGQVGAVTFGSGTTGVTGAVSAANSLVGTSAFDQVGSGGREGLGGITALTNGNYVVSSPTWNNGAAASAGAVTFGNGTTGITGAVSAANSLVGTTAADLVGIGGVGGVTALTNGNYVVASFRWANGAATRAGAVTFGSGTTGVTGVVSAANSLVGTTANDQVGDSGFARSAITALTNGNYVVSSGRWNNGAATNAGAVTFGSGTTGVSGAVSAANSLVGTTANDQVGSDDQANRSGITALSNGNYVVGTFRWNNGAATQAGAVTFGSGTSGVSGAVSAANSLVGTTAFDQVGFQGVTALSNGNYVVSSSNWANGAATQAGAVTFGSGTTGVTGAVSAANSLVGTTASDFVGFGVTALSNGNYVVRSQSWDNGAVVNVGAVTFGSGTTGVSGAVSAANSLVGTTAGDNVGFGGVTPLSSGNVVVSSPFARNGAIVGAGLVHVLSPSGGGGAFANPLTFATTPFADATITPAGITAITNTGTAVVLQANNDITLAASSNIVTSAGGAGGAITMQAGRSVLLNSNITTDNGNLAITANDAAADGTYRDAGAGGITLAAGTVLNAGTGTVLLAVGTESTVGNIAFGSGSSVAGSTLTVSGTGSALISAGTVTLDAATTVSNLNISGISTLLGTGNVTVNGAFNWSGGTIAGGPGVLTTNATSSVTAGFIVGLDGRTWNNAGTVNQSGGSRVVFSNSAVVNNQLGAQWNLSSTDAFPLDSAGTFNNAGTFTNSGATAHNLSIAAFNNSGQVNVAAGTLALNGGGTSAGAFAVGTGATLNFGGGTHALGATSSVTGAGTVAFGGGTTNIGGTYNVTGTTSISGATVNFDTAALTQDATLSSGRMGGSGSLTVNSTAGWPGTDMVGTLNIAAGASLGISGGSRFFVGTVNNSGTTNWSSGTLQSSSGTSFFNNLAGAQFNLTGNTATETCCSGGVVTYSNAAGATLTKSGAGSTSNFNGGATFNNAGTVNVSTGTLNLSAGGSHGGSFGVASGATLAFSGGTHTLSATPLSSVTGAGTVAFSGGVSNVGGTYNVTGTTAVNGGTVNFDTAALTQDATLSSGRVGGIGSLTVNGTASWPGIDLVGMLNIAAGASLGISGGSRFFVGTVNNSGTTNWSSGTLQSSSGTSFFNNLAGAQFNLTGNTATETCCSGGVVTYSNAAGATLTKSGAGSTSNFNGGATFSNAGTVNVSTGTLSLAAGGTDSGSFAVASGATLGFNGGTHALGATSSVTGAGTVAFGGGTTNIGGTYNVTGTTSINGSTANFNVSALTQDATLSSGRMGGSGSLTVNGTAGWPGTDMVGTLNIAAGASLGISGGSRFFVGTVNNSGTTNWSSGTLQSSSGTSFFNNLAGAQFNLTGNTATETCCSGGVVTYSNAAGATLTKSGAGSTSNFNGGATFSNAGTVNVASGTLQLSSFPTNDGTINVASGATLSTNGNALTNAAITGVIAGSGTLDLGAATLTNNGALQPGGAGTVGTLAITGNYVQGSGGSLDVDLASGSSYDVLAVSGGATLNGTLNVNYLGVYTGAGGSHALISSPAVSGTFSPINDVHSLTPNYGPNYFVLGALANTWTGGAADFLWATAGNWSLVHEPTAGEDATIPNLTGTPTISIVGGAHTPKSFTFLGDDNFTISGGSLMFTSPSSIALGTLKLTGGALTASNTSLTAKNLNFSSGTLAGIGASTATVTGALALSGPAAKVLNQITLVNQGAGTWTGTGNLQLDNTSTFSNAGMLDVQNDAQIFTSTSGATFNNSGTFTKSAGTGTTTIAGNFFTNSGTVNANSGTVANQIGGTHTGTFTAASGATLAFTGATDTFNAGGISGAAGSTISIAGATVDINPAAIYSAATTTIGSGALNVNGTATTATLNLAGGTLGGTGSLAVTSAYSDTGGSINLGGALSITQATGNLVLGIPITAGTLSLSALTGAISQTGALTVSGTANISAGNAPITLTNPGNDFQGVVTLGNFGANPVAISDANTITFSTMILGGDFTVTAPSIGLNGVSNTGFQQYNGNVSLNGSFPTNGGAFNVTGTTKLGGASTINAGAGAITLTGAVDSAAATNNSLALFSSSVETFGSTIGATQALSSISTDAPGTVSLGGNVTTTGAQTFNDAVTAGSVTLTSTGGGAIFVNNASFGFPSGISTTGAVTFAGPLVGTSGAPLALLVTPAGLAFTQVATAFLSAPSVPAAIAAPSGSSITINGALFAASAATALSGTPAACSGLLDPTTGACTPAPQIPPPPPQVLPPAPPQASAPPQDTGGGTAADAGTPATGEGTGGTETRRRRAPRCG